jgi:hypothetical protein
MILALYTIVLAAAIIQEHFHVNGVNSQTFKLLSQREKIEVFNFQPGFTNSFANSQQLYTNLFTLVKLFEINEMYKNNAFILHNNATIFHFSIVFY